MFWLKGRYYFASHNGFVVERFAGMLMDGRPLPASSEQLNEMRSCHHPLADTVVWREKMAEEAGGF